VLRILKDRQKKEIHLDLKCKAEHFKDDRLAKSHPTYKADNDLLSKLYAKAVQIVEDFEREDYDFTLDEFKTKFKGVQKYQDSNVIKFFNEIIDELTRSGRTGNARAYEESKAALVKFGGENLSFKSINPTFLEKFEVFLRENNNGNGGVSFKMRELRAVFNKAIIRDIISQETYPFKTYKISKLKSSKNKRALTIAEFKQIKNVDLSKNPHLVDAYNYFMFSFYNRGINFVDMMKLKWTDIRNGRIYYVRSKTKGSFDMEIMDKTQEILEYYKKQNRPTKYVFPILLSDNLTPIQIEYRKKKVLQTYNSRLKEIAKLVDVDKRLTSYVARHSFATILKQKGTSTDKISELMGHADVQVTMTYLKEFDNETLDNENRKLLDL
jgi:integrase